MKNKNHFIDLIKEEEDDEVEDLDELRENEGQNLNKFYQLEAKSSKLNK
jgi:hypothetical protein